MFPGCLGPFTIRVKLVYFEGFCQVTNCFDLIKPNAQGVVPFWINHLFDLFMYGIVFLQHIQRPFEKFPQL